MNIPQGDVNGDVSTKLLCRDTSRDDCITSFLRDTIRDGRDVSRDDCRNPFRRYTSKDNHRNLLCRDVSRDDCRTLFRRYINSDDNTCTTLEMSSWRWCKISSSISIVRDVCRDKLAFTVPCRS